MSPLHWFCRFVNDSVETDWRALFWLSESCQLRYRKNNFLQSSFRQVEEVAEQDGHGRKWIEYKR